MKYYLVGPMPPPLGGVSVFIYRYAKILNKRGYDVCHFDRSKMSILNKLYYYTCIIIDMQKCIYHLNGPDFMMMLLLLVRPFPIRIIYHDHSGRILENFSWVKKMIFKLFFIRVNKCIFVGGHIKKYYDKHKIGLPQKLIIKNAFLPPPIQEEEAIWKSYSNETIYFITTRKPLVIANAFQIMFFQGTDLYGLDLCVELVMRLKTKYPNVGLVFALAEINNRQYYADIIQRIKKYEIVDNIHFLTGQKEIWPLFKKMDLMIRPTFNDGYGISIAEALYMGCAAVASDVCDRPEGTVLFKNRDIDDLESKALAILEGVC